MKRILCFLLILLVFTASSCDHSTVSGFNGDYDEPLGLNSDKTLRTIGSWTKTGIVNHWHSGMDFHISN